MPETLAIRWMKRYKVFFLLGLSILAIQIFLAYKSLRIPYINAITNSDTSRLKVGVHQKGANYNSVADDEDINSNLNVPSKTKDNISVAKPSVLNIDDLGFIPECEITTKEAISAIHRARTKNCKKQIVNTTCLIQSGKFYANSLPNYCPKANYTTNKPLGCYKDEKEFRLLSGYYTNFKTNNSPKKCIQMCLQSGFPYAGVQYSSECFCGTEKPPNAAKLPDPSCNMKCPGDPKEACGGYFSINIYETGIAKFAAQVAETIPKPETDSVRIAFLLTLNGRALRQVHRLIKALYSPNHIFYIHVDSRQDYLYRELLVLESKFKNIRLARQRFSTIWGGASLLTMLLQCMRDLLISDWEWDFVINLSESDFPVKTNDKLVDFLTANKGHNFVKSHGRETQRFIQKQGLDKTFVECDTHMWRIGDRELPNGIQIDGGSDWIALSKSFVEYVTKPEGDTLLEGLMTIFRHTLLPAESFFHTVLRNSKFCGTYIDNNLHVTNWKRRLGCKCQYKHVVDWCGCSPNDFKPEDWPRLAGTESKYLYFARKFEPIINQAIILQLEEWLFGPYTSDYLNLNGYWQNIYHYEDASPPADDAALTISHSLLRLMGKVLNMEPVLLKEITNFKHNDEYKGFILKYTTKFPNGSYELETRIRPSQSWQTARNSNLAKRIRNFEVSSEFDQKEQIARNFAKFLGPYSEPVLHFRFVGSAQTDNHSYNLTALWIDPSGTLQDFNEIHVEDGQSESINFSKANLKRPIIPGIWTVKLIGKMNLYAQTKFLITPLSIEGGKPIKELRSKIVNLGSKNDITYPSEWQQYLLSSSEVQLYLDRVESNSKRFGVNLTTWIDGLVNKFFFIRESCIVEMNHNLNIGLPICKDTTWSTYAPDPKSDVYVLIQKR